MVKNRLRSKLREILINLSEQQKAQKSSLACKNLISTDYFKNAAVVMIFLSMSDEVDTTDVIVYGLDKGKIMAIPRVFWNEKYMIPLKLNSVDDEFSIETGGLRNPVGGEEIVVESIDLVVTPALGFDRKGHRIGRSGGFYDRFFANDKLKAVKCGLGFAEQVLEEVFVPAESTDIPIDLLVTDNEVIYFNEKKGVL